MLVSISPPALDVIIDLKYATADNIAGRPIYRHGAAMLEPEAARALARAVDLACGVGCRIVIYDAFRPVEAQWELWRVLPDPDYVADPRVGSNHSRGVAVDVGLADAATGAALDMGTGFDEMVPRSHHGRADISPVARRNRALLLGIMTAAGWAHIPTEWWHYQLPNAGAYPLLWDSAAGGRMMG
jgi:zinc D-Ala-D-Ala dipeptidase